MELTDEEKLYIANLIFRWESAGFQDCQGKIWLVIPLSDFVDCDLFDIDYYEMVRELKLSKLGI